MRVELLAKNVKGRIHSKQGKGKLQAYVNLTKAVQKYPGRILWVKHSINGRAFTYVKEEEYQYWTFEALKEIKAQETFDKALKEAEKDEFLGEFKREAERLQRESE